MRPKAIYKPPIAPTPTSTPSPRPKRTRRLHRRPRPPPTINWSAARARLYTFVAQTLAGLVLGYVFFLLLCAWDDVRGGLPNWRELVCPDVGVRRVVCVEPGREDVDGRWTGQEKVEWGDGGDGGGVVMWGGGDVGR